MKKKPTKNRNTLSVRMQAQYDDGNGIKVYPKKNRTQKGKSK